MNVPTWLWWTTIILSLAVLAIDFYLVAKNPHEPAKHEVRRSLAIYIGMAILFGILVWALAGAKYGTEFFAGWLTEYSLSIDNLFIFIILMSKFKVPKQFQQTALMIGIVLALLMRGVFIAVGAAAIEQFSWVFYLFGFFLIYSAVKLLNEGAEDEEEDDENKLVALASKYIPATDRWTNGTKLFVKQGSKYLATPMFFIVLALGTTDLLFALDSIPAIYGLTSEPYLVLTANIFALMGLRQLYFLLGDLLKRLVYLSYGLAILLGFIGVKLILHALHSNELSFINGGNPIPVPEIPTWMSLVAIVLILGLTTFFSLRASAKMSVAERDELSGPRRDWDDEEA